MTTNFQLKDKNSKKTAIYCQIRYGKSRFKYYFGISIPVEFWDFKNKKLVKSKRFAEYFQVNQILINVDKRIKNEYYKFVNLNDREPTVVEFKKVLNRKTDLDVFEYIEDYILEHKDRKEQGTLKTYSNTLRMIRRFVRKDKLQFNDLTMDWFFKFRDWMNDKNYSANYQNKIIVIFNIFLNQATKDGVNNLKEYKDFNIKEVEVDSVYLTEDELEKLLNVKLPKHLEEHRDLFAVGCYTGLRYSDFSQLKLEDIMTIDGVEVIKKVMKKVKETVIVPLHPVVKQIVEKYNGFPKHISNQKTNDALKEICKRAGIDEKVILHKTEGGRKVTHIHKKYEIVSTHTARRTFATLAYLAGVPTISIRKITGHQSERSFKRYIKVTKQENAIKLASHHFFKTKKT